MRLSRKPTNVWMYVGLRVPRGDGDGEDRVPFFVDGPRHLKSPSRLLSEDVKTSTDGPLYLGGRVPLVSGREPWYNIVTS